MRAEDLRKGDVISYNKLTTEGRKRGVGIVEHISEITGIVVTTNGMVLFPNLNDWVTLEERPNGTVEQNGPERESNTDGTPEQK